jgi:hypothetical protein
MQRSWAVFLLIGFQLGLAVGLLAGHTLWQVPDPPVGSLERLLREMDAAVPRLEWQQ